MNQADALHFSFHFKAAIFEIGNGTFPCQAFPKSGTTNLLILSNVFDKFLSTASISNKHEHFVHPKMRKRNILCSSVANFTVYILTCSVLLALCIELQSYMSINVN
mgnify:FL=1